MSYLPLQKINLFWCRVLAIKEEWMAVPKQGLQCFLWGVKHNEDYDIKTCVELLQENIFVSPLLVKVKVIVCF